jgi:hypothetical protein
VFRLRGKCTSIILTWLPVHHGVPCTQTTLCLSIEKHDIRHANFRAPSICSFPIADHFNSLGVINKQDYARRHGWELHLSAENVDPSAIVSHCLEPPLFQVLSSSSRTPAYCPKPSNS